MLSKTTVVGGGVECNDKQNNKMPRLSDDPKAIWIDKEVGCSSHCLFFSKQLESERQYTLK